MRSARLLYFAVSAMLVLPQPAVAFTLPRSSIVSYSRQPRTPIYFPNPSKTSSSSSSTLRLSVSTILLKDPFYCLSAVLLLSTFGISLERRTVVGKALSAPLATMALALFVANVGIVPFEAPIYSVINKYIVPLAVPMLLFDSDLRRVMRDTGSLLVAFVVGAFATVAATILAFPLVPMLSLGDNNWRVACSLAARHIGGAINFVAVAETLNIAGSVVSAAIAADNVVVAIYFAILFALAKETVPSSNEESSSKNIKVQGDFEYSLVDSDEESKESRPESSQMDLPSVAISLSVSASLVTVGGILTKAFLPKGTSALPLTSALTVAAATVFPKFFSRIRTAGTALGIVFIQMFFAVSGAAGSIRLVFQQAPALFAFSAVQVAVHFGILMGVGRGLFRLDANELYLASNANVGGPTTAAAMAQAKHWKRLVLPALLTGILGYAVATPIALLLGPILCRLPILGSF